jgi:hypothetical protein
MRNIKLRPDICAVVNDYVLDHLTHVLGLTLLRVGRDPRRAQTRSGRVVERPFRILV